MFTNNFFKIFVFLFVAGFFLMIVVAPVWADENPVHGLPKASERLKNIGDQSGLGSKTLEQTVGGLIKGALALVGTIFLALTVYGGYVWMTARGEEQEAERAKGIITTAVIGLAVVLAAYAITYFIVYRLTQASA